MPKALAIALQRRWQASAGASEPFRRTQRRAAPVVHRARSSHGAIATATSATF
jgi:hypothetical protein